MLIVGLLSVCSVWGVESLSAKSTRQLTEKDTGRAIDLHMGDKLQISLPGNPSTGFQWELQSVAASILKPIAKPEFSPSGAALGAPGKFIFNFEAVAAGSTTLQLIYHRPFASDAPPVQTFKVTVTVR